MLVALLSALASATGAPGTGSAVASGVASASGVYALLLPFTSTVRICTPVSVPFVCPPIRSCGAPLAVTRWVCALKRIVPK